MKIKIISSKTQKWWYADRIGEVFEVADTQWNFKDAYIVRDKNDDLCGTVMAEDCDIVEK